jgi:hypothetical protein
MQNLASVNKRWAAGNVCAVLTGAILTLALSNPAKIPLLNGIGQPRVISQINHYFFPVGYVVVAAVFAFVVFRRRGIGFWSIFLSFFIGGLLASFFLVIG